MDRDEVVALTREHGGEWGIQHTRRLLHLVTLIRENDDYDGEAVWLAAHLHDWGGYERWARTGVDHAERSAEVAADYLRERRCPEARLTLVLEAIRTHHSGGPGRSVEAMLLSDADALDFLGSVGVLRIFSMKGRDLRGAFDSSRQRRQRLPGLLCFDTSRALGEARVREMDDLMAAFERDSFGLF